MIAGRTRLMKRRYKRLSKKNLFIYQLIRPRSQLLVNINIGSKSDIIFGFRHFFMGLLEVVSLAVGFTAITAERRTPFKIVREECVVCGSTDGVG